MEKLFSAQKTLDKNDARQLNPLVLASVGDAVYSLAMRTHVLLTHDLGAHALHSHVSALVCARAQREAYFMLEDTLSEDEQYIAHRGRNSHPATVPKNADVSDYRTATALEAVFGYLYLTGQSERICELTDIILEKTNEKV